MALKPEAKVKQCLPNGAIKSHRLYSRWNVMRRRCYDPQFIVYRYYGGRGIRVCDEWRTDYLAFQAWALSHGWDENLTLDRIDNTKDYSPENCRWTDWVTQQSNRGSFNLKVTIHGKTKCICQWADELGISRRLVCRRVQDLGWSPRRALLTPSRGTRATPITYRGQTMTMYMWAKKIGFNRSWAYQRLKQGMTFDQIIKRVEERKQKQWR